MTINFYFTEPKRNESLPSGFGHPANQSSAGSWSLLTTCSRFRWSSRSAFLGRLVRLPQRITLLGKVIQSAVEITPQHGSILRGMPTNMSVVPDKIETSYISLFPAGPATSERGIDRTWNSTCYVKVTYRPSKSIISSKSCKSLNLRS